MIELDLITGFLGAGKTTFANRLLHYYQSQNLRVVYVVNEFGETTLDSQLIAADGFTVRQVNSGCICCSLKNEISLTILELLQGLKPDRIVFEPSGIFIPENFAAILKDEKLKGQIHLSRQWCIIDPALFQKYKMLPGSFAYKQIATAPALIVSKLSTSLNSQDNVWLRIRAINPEAYIFAEPFSRLDDIALKRLLQAAQSEGLPSAQESVNSSRHDNYQSLSLKGLPCYQKDELEQILSQVTQSSHGQLWRAKGTVIVENQAQLINFSLSGWTTSPWTKDAQGEIVLIGTALEEERLKKLFTCQE